MMALQRGVTGFSVPFFVVMMLSSVFDFIDIGWVFWLAPIGLIVGVAYGIAHYYRFEYEVTSTTVDVASGVLSRRSREIPYRRIQNVDVTQGVVQRLLGLAVVSIETAGGGDTEATLNFVSEEEASRLQREIRRRTAEVKDRRRSRTTDSDPEEADAIESEPTTDEATAGADAARDRSIAEPDDAASPAEPDRRERSFDRERERRQRLFALEPRELLLYSFTSFRPAAVAAVMFLFFLATDRVVELLVATAQPFGGPSDLASGDAGSYGVFTLVSFVNGIAITYAVSVAYTFATYYDFRLGRVGDDFVYERGLLQRYSGSIPAEKVQSVTITDNPLQRLIGYAGLWVETAGYGPDSDGGSQSAVPLAEGSRIHRFAENLTGVDAPSFRSPPTLARRRYLVRFSLVAATIVAIAYGVAQVTPINRWYLAAIVFAAVPPAAHLRYVHLGYYVGEDHLVIRRGFWRRRTTVIPYYRIQTVSTRRSIFQRRLGLASVVVDTASSRSFFWDASTIYDIELDDARDVHETGRKKLQTALRKRARSDGPDLSVEFT